MSDDNNKPNGGCVKNWEFWLRINALFEIIGRERQEKGVAVARKSYGHWLDMVNAAYIGLYRLPPDTTIVPRNCHQETATVAAVVRSVFASANCGVTPRTLHVGSFPHSCPTFYTCAPCLSYSIQNSTYAPSLNVWTDFRLNNKPMKQTYAYPSESKKMTNICFHRYNYTTIITASAARFSRNSPAMTGSDGQISNRYIWTVIGSFTWFTESIP